MRTSEISVVVFSSLHWFKFFSSVVYLLFFSHPTSKGMPHPVNTASLDQVTHALEVLHGTSDDSQRKQAEKFLEDFEETVRIFFRVTRQSNLVQKCFWIEFACQIITGNLTHTGRCLGTLSRYFGSQSGFEVSSFRCEDLQVEGNFSNQWVKKLKIIFQWEEVWRFQKEKWRSSESLWSFVTFWDSTSWLIAWLADRFDKSWLMRWLIDWLIDWLNIFAPRLRVGSTISLLFIFCSQVIHAFANLDHHKKIYIRDILLHHVSRTNSKDDRAVMVAVSPVSLFLRRKRYFCLSRKSSWTSFSAVMRRTGRFGAPDADMERGHEGGDRKVGGKDIDRSVGRIKVCVILFHFQDSAMIRRWCLCYWSCWRCSPKRYP